MHRSHSSRPATGWIASAVRCSTEAWKRAPRRSSTGSSSIAATSRCSAPYRATVRHVVAKEEVLPVWVHRVDTLKLGLRSNLWLQAAWPSRSAGGCSNNLSSSPSPKSLSVDVVVHADSDVVLIRPFSAEAVVDGERSGAAVRAPGATSTRPCPTTSAGIGRPRTCSMSPGGPPMPDYISTLGPLEASERGSAPRTRAANDGEALASSRRRRLGRLRVRALRPVRARRARRARRPVRLARHPSAWTTTSACRSPCPELTTFLDGVDEEAIAVSLTAKAGMDPDDYVQLLERRWVTAGDRLVAADITSGHVVADRVAVRTDRVPRRSRRSM